MNELTKMLLNLQSKMELSVRSHLAKGARPQKRQKQSVGTDLAIRSLCLQHNEGKMSTMDYIFGIEYTSSS